MQLTTPFDRISSLASSDQATSSQERTDSPEVASAKGRCRALFEEATAKRLGEMVDTYMRTYAHEAIKLPATDGKFLEQLTLTVGNGDEAVFERTPSGQYTIILRPHSSSGTVMINTVSEEPHTALTHYTLEGGKVAARSIEGVPENPMGLAMQEMPTKEALRVLKETESLLRLATGRY